MSFSEYYLLVSRVRPAVETFTGVKWEVPEYGAEVERLFHNIELFSLYLFPRDDFYRYLVYLRHHGFPSPLLDWSRSPYVAAFFAFRDTVTQAERRSIYVYCEAPKGIKGGPVRRPTIRPIGPYVRSHPRHFRQQSDYTICGEFDEASGWRFCPHQPVFGRHGMQDLLWKFTLPSTERTKILRSLNDYNLNAFSLFESEESLLETMWVREHILRLKA